MRSVYSENEEKPEFWFNLKTLKVEVGKKSAATYRIGPFDSAASALKALEKVRERNEEWREDD